MSDGISIRFGNNLATWLTVVITVASMAGAVFFGGTAVGANRRILELPEELAKTRGSLESKIDGVGQSIDSIKNRLTQLEFNVSGANGLVERFGKLSERLDKNIEADSDRNARIRELEILINPRKP